MHGGLLGCGLLGVQRSRPCCGAGEGYLAGEVAEPADGGFGLGSLEVFESY